MNWCAQVFQNSLEVTDCLCQKFGHGLRVVKQEETLIGPLGVTQGLGRGSKVGQNVPNWAKTNLPPILLKGN